MKTIKSIREIVSSEDLTVGALKKLLAELPDNMPVKVMDLEQHDWPFTIQAIRIGCLENGVVSDAGTENELLLEVW